VPAASARLQAAFPDVDLASVRLDATLGRTPLLSPGDRIESPGLLFQKLAPEQLEEWAARFGGAEAAS
jgi:hypothetical protein